MAKKAKAPGKNIKGKCKGDAVKLVVKKNQKADGTTAELDFDITRTQKQCASLFGEDFARLAFGSMIETTVEDGTETAHLAKSITASDRFRLGKHLVKLDSFEVVATPKLQKVFPVEKSDKVVVSVRMPVHVGLGDDLGSKLVGLVSQDVVDIEFSPTDMELPGI